MTDFSGYLRSLSTTYEKWWHCYTLTDAEGRAELRPETFDFGWVETVRPAERDGDRAESRTQVERLPVLAGLRKYAAGHVLLVGRPGSGKSTALARLVLEEAQQAGPIPVLVELRYWQGSIVDLIRAFLGRHGLQVDRAQVEKLLFDRRLLLCVDGLNELPSEAGRQDVARLRRDFPQVAMIFTTRDLSLGGDFGVERKLEMQALTEPQMREFVRSYLPAQGEAMLRQLGDRLREFGQTPLLLWMLCGLFRQSGQIPANLGEMFRAFTQHYERNLKGDVLPEGDRRWWAELLQELAAAMLRGAGVELRVAIGKAEVCSIFAEFLADREAQPAGAARKCLEDLLKHHLILANGEQVEFRHQLIQEYYAAEWLLGRVGGLGNGELKREFLNFLKWTEPVALMLALVEEEALAVRVVRLGLKVDLMLGARLAGEVKPRFQGQTVGFVDALEVPGWLKVELLGRTRSEEAVIELLNALNSQDINVVEAAAKFLGETDNQAAIKLVSEKLEGIDADFFAQSSFGGADRTGEVWTIHIRALAYIAPQKTVKFLRNKVIDQMGRWDIVLNFLTDASEILMRLDADALVPELLEMLQHSQSDEQKNQVLNLIRYAVEHDSVIPRLVEILQQEEGELIKVRIIGILGESKNELARSTLVNLIGQDNYKLREEAAKQLINQKPSNMLGELHKLLNHPDWNISWCAAVILGNHGDSKVISIMTHELENHEQSGIRRTAVRILGKMGDESVVPFLLKAFGNDSDRSVRREAAFSLSYFKRQESLHELISMLSDGSLDECREAIRSLARLEVEEPLLELVEVEHIGWQTAAVELGRLGRTQVLPTLLKALARPENEPFSGIRKSLSELADAETVNLLISAFEDSLLIDFAEPYFFNRLALVLVECQHKILAKHLLSLVKVINRKYVKQLFWVIPAIQSRCKFYNYEIWQDYLTAQKTDRPTNQRGDPSITQNFYGPTYGVAGNVEGDQITPPANSVD
jgi:HEAT repeat protein